MYVRRFLLEREGSAKTPLMLFKDWIKYQYVCEMPSKERVGRVETTETGRAEAHRATERNLDLLKCSEKILRRSREPLVVWFYGLHLGCSG